MKNFRKDHAMHRLTRSRLLGGALFTPVAILAAPALALAAGPVSVTVNGSAVALSPAPITRAGRVFVPLRGIFEHLGASVVYANGTINATGQGNRTISLHIGSTSATVNGVAQPLDVAPFVIGASTYVPLRFVGQALGATVNFDGTNQIVAITTGPGGPPPAMAPAAGGLALQGEQPPRDGSVAAVKPTISTDFSTHVDPNSVHVALDGRDVTSAATLSSTGIIYAPSSPLQAGRHQVQITGTDASGQAFTKQWMFSSGTTEAANFIHLRQLHDGAAISGTQFTIDGVTLPNARIHVVAGASRSLGNVFNFATGNFTGDAIADGAGHFSVDVALQTAPGGVISVDITSTDAATKASAEQKLHLTSQ